MNILVQLLSDASTLIFAEALLHSLWQGVCIALVLYALLCMIPPRQSETRYIMACCGLLAFLGLFFLTISFMSLPSSNAAKPVLQETVLSGGIASPPHPSNQIIVAAVSPNPSITPGSDVIFMSIHWEKWFISFWGIGLIIMVLRLLRQIQQDRGIIQDSIPLDNEEITGMIKRLQDGMQVTKKVLILTSERIASPAVIGIFSPVILIPLSLITGMPAAYIQAIAAHELAHIRRWDYLINILQMLVEAFFFFNPAVWWINRQIRTEREVCCDAAAIRHCGNDSQYLKALAVSAENLLNPAWETPMMLFSNPVQHGLVDRVLRIAKPSYRPKPKLSWGGLWGCTLIAILLIACMKEGANFTADKVSQWFLTEKQVEKITQIQSEYIPQINLEMQPNTTSRGISDCTIAGVILPPTGETIPVDLQIILESAKDSIGVSVKDGGFTQPVEQGYYKVFGYSKQIAYYESGKIINTVTGETTNLAIQLETGFPAQVKILDASQSPVEGAAGVIRSIFIRQWNNASSYNYYGDNTFSTDAGGLITFPHSSHGFYNIQAVKHGFQSAELNLVRFNEGTPLIITLQKCHPVHGKVINKLTKQPIENAVISTLEKKVGHQAFYPQKSFYCNTDKDGLFTIDTIEDSAVYTIVAEAAEYRSAVISQVLPGQSDIIVELGPPVTVAGYVYPVETSKNDSLHLEYMNEYIGSAGTTRESRNSTPLRLDGDKGFFAITQLWPGKLTLCYANKNLILNASKPVFGLIFNVTATMAPVNSGNPIENTRAVILHFSTTNGSALPSGKIKADILSNAAFTEHRVSSYTIEDTKYFSIEKGIAGFDVVPPCYIKISPYQLNGGWFEDIICPEQILPASAPYQQTIAVIPAGSIYGKVLDERGHPVNALLEIHTLHEFKPDNKFRNVEANSLRQSYFYFSPLPLGESFSLSAVLSNYVLKSPKIILTPKDPAQELIFHFKKGIDIKGKVMDRDNNPVTGIEIRFSYQREPNASIQVSTLKTDGNGEFILENINPDIKKYDLHIEPAKTYLQKWYSFSPARNNLLIKLDKGKILNGYVMDADTNKPVRNIQVTAKPLEQGSVEYSPARAETVTGEHGAFRFSNLVDKVYALQIEPMLLSLGGENYEYIPVKDYFSTGGENLPVTLFVRLKKK